MGAGCAERFMSGSARGSGCDSPGLLSRDRDNGCGVDPRVLDAGREGHWGLAGMQERAAKIGGLLKICSNASTGTEVELPIPSSIALELSLANRPSE
jgi:signal transduction histidine kinase